MNIFRRKPRLNAVPDPKPVTLSIELEDGQWRTWKLGVGDAVGLGGIRVDVHGERAILVSRYSEQAGDGYPDSFA